MGYFQRWSVCECIRWRERTIDRCPCEFSLLFPQIYPYFSLLVSQWHPSAPRLASTTNQGTILIWHSPSPERWGAFAGGFEEADENVWYEEGESEFDLASFLKICSEQTYNPIIKNRRTKPSLRSEKNAKKTKTSIFYVGSKKVSFSPLALD